MAKKINIPVKLSQLKLSQLKLNQRERTAVILAVAGIMIFLVIQLVISPIISKQDQLKRSLAAEKTAYDQMIVLKTEYAAATKSVEQSKSKLRRRQSDFRLFSFLDALAGQTGIKDRIAYMKPSTTSRKNSPYKYELVEMKIQDITMKQLIAYLYRVETSKNVVTVPRISINKTDKTEGLLDAVLQVETIQI